MGKGVRKTGNLSAVLILAGFFIAGYKLSKRGKNAI